MKISEIIEKNRKSIILIDIQKPGKEGKKQIGIRGTGFMVSSDGRFVTNAHVYKQIPPGELPFLGVSVPGETDEKKSTHYERFPIKLLEIDEENDFALMQIISDKKFEAVSEMGNSEAVKEGDEVIYIGYPLATELLSMGFGITITTNKCIISSIKRRGVDGSLHFFLVDTHTNNGSSGSPVFSVDTGEIIGVVSGKISARVPTQDGKMIDVPANIGICRPIQYAVNLIKKNKDK